MSFEHVVHETERYVEVRFWDALTTDSVVAYLQQVWLNHPELHGFSELIDFRPIEKAEMDTGQLAEIVEVGRMLDDANQESKMAMVITDKHDVFKGSLFLALQDLYPVRNKQVEIFKDEETARHWILADR
ncbi:MAG: hypothetical protein GY723_09760 [bacterium]|nr:hypothetical protein [bacterium]